MNIIKITRNRLFAEFPHQRRLTKLGLTISDLNERLKGRIRLLNKFIDNAIKRGAYEEEEESLYAFSKRISKEIKFWRLTKGI